MNKTWWIRFFKVFALLSGIVLAFSTVVGLMAFAVITFGLPGFLASVTLVLLPAVSAIYASDKSLWE